MKAKVIVDNEMLVGAAQYIIDERAWKKLSAWARMVDWWVDINRVQKLNRARKFLKGQPQCQNNTKST